MPFRTRLLIAAAFASLAPAGVLAQIAVSANDGKQTRPTDNPPGMRPDTVQVLDLGSYPPRVIGSVAAPASMIGPPTSVALSRKGDFAIVTAAQDVDPADGTKTVPGGKVSVIDLKNPSQPVVVQSLTAGPGASGVSINGAGNLALIASTTDGSVSVYSVSGKRLTSVGKVQLDTKTQPVDVAISPDGKTALVTQRQGTGIWRLAINGTKVTDTGTFFETGGQPYGVVFSRDGKYAYNTNLQGRLGAPATGPRSGTITTIDLAKNAVVETLDVGQLPEHVALSPDGKFIAAVIVNGSTANPTAPNYNPNGLLKVFRVHGPKLTQVAEAPTGSWGQGATWDKTGKVILFQSATTREIEVFRFRGTALTRDAAATIKVDARPGAINTAFSR